MSNSNVLIPQGEDKIIIELSVKEAMALTGVRFFADHESVLDARKKIKESVDEKLKEINLQ
jgi:hypothetical protein